MVAELTGMKTISTASEDYESCTRIDSMLKEISRQDSRAGKVLRRMLKKKIVDGVVTLGPVGVAFPSKTLDKECCLTAKTLFSSRPKIAAIP
jgi:coenzyme F420-reducing hydrogenase beta subunit